MEIIKENIKLLDSLRHKTSYDRNEMAFLVNFYNEYCDKTDRYCLGCGIDGEMKGKIYEYYLLHRAEFIEMIEKKTSDLQKESVQKTQNSDQKTDDNAKTDENKMKTSSKLAKKYINSK